MQTFNELLDNIYNEIKAANCESNIKVEYIICNLGYAYNSNDFERAFELIKNAIHNKNVFEDSQETIDGH